jgi:5-methylcytosine-specific restriction enzyme subunit McrC
MSWELNLYEYSRIYPLPLNSRSESIYDQDKNLKLSHKLFEHLIDEIKLFNFELIKARPFEIKQSGKEIFIQINNYVGSVYTNNFIINIIPKIFIEEHIAIEDKRRITELLIIKSKISPLGLDYFFEFRFSDKLSLNENFINHFLNNLAEVFGTSISKSYNRVEKYTPFIKGKLLINRPVSGNMVCCEFDQLSLDNNTNRLIKSALNVLLLSSKSNKNIIKIKLYLGYLNGVPNFDLKKLPLIPPINSDKRLKDLVSMANFILQNNGVNSQIGRRSISSMLFPMEKVFENYLANYFSIISDELEFSLPSNKFFMAKDLNGHNLVKLKPDFQLEFDQKFLLADAKWKVVDDIRNDLQSNDLYQMYAYGNKWIREKDKDLSLALIYPIVGNSKPVSEDLILIDELPLKIRFFNLSSVLDVEQEKVEFFSLLNEV